MVNNNTFFWSFIMLWTINTSFSQTVSQEYKVGDKSDGSRFKPVHLLKLYDENGNTIHPNDSFELPFSTKQTCGNECHNYEIISDGFHFNYHSSDRMNESKNEPWIYTDPTTLSIIPLSYRKNIGVFSPEDVNMTPMQFLFRFGPYYPGGDISELDSLENSKNHIRWLVSGKLEINCLICHDTDPYYDQAEYASNIRKQNFKWASAASSSFTEFEGNASKMPDNFDIYNLTTVQTIDQRSSTPPSIKYDKSKFNSENKVYFNVSKNIPNDNCYYCHSSIIADNSFDSNWKSEEDVHIKAGISCVDCHRNGLNHNMIKGTENKLAEGYSFTCEGCHIDNSLDSKPMNGNLGAPIPEHTGIPPVHFEKLSCTTCHSGDWPTKQAKRIKTSRNHFLGMHGTNKSPDVYPHITTNIFTKSSSNKIEPRNVIWPSFWGSKKGDNIIPLPIDFVVQTIRPMLALDSLFNFGEWPSISDSIVISVLDSLNSLNITEGNIVFVTGGKRFELVNEKLIITDDIHSKGISWRTAHSVRPASQALGINGCDDCHSVGSAFFTKEIKVKSSIVSQLGETISVSKFQDNCELYQTAFSLTFFFRPWLKFLILISALVIIIVLSGYFFYGMKTISNLFFSNAKK